MTYKKKKNLSSGVTGITIYITPIELDLNSLRCAYTNPTISDKDRRSQIEEHIEKYSEAWRELAKK